MDNSITVQIKQFPQPPAEPSDNSASHSSGNGYKATPDIQIGIDPCMETQMVVMKMLALIQNSWVAGCWVE